MLKFNSVTKMNFFSSLLIIFLLTFSLTYYLLKAKYDDFLAQSKILEMKSLEYQKQLLQNEVERSISFISYKKSLLQTRLGADLKKRVDEVVQLANNIYQKNRNHRSLNEIKSMVKETIRPMSDNLGDGYFFATSLDGYEQLYPPHPDMENKNILDLQDSHGSYVILDEIKIAKEKGSGFVEHYWPKPKLPAYKFYLKISYIKIFKPFNWYFGSGKYIDDAEEELKDESVEYIHSIKFGKTDEDGLFVIDRTDNNERSRFGVIKHSKADTLETKKDFYCQDYYNELSEQIKLNGSGFAKFYTKNTDDKAAKTKIIYLKEYRDWNWVVGAILDVSDLYLALDSAKAEIKGKLLNELISILLITIVFFILAALFSFYVSRQMRKEFVVFSDFFNHAAIDNRVLNIGSLDISEFKSLAESLNLMIYKREIIEKRLKENENTFRSFMDHADEFMIIKDLESRYVMVNQKFKEILNISYSDIIGKTPQEIGYNGVEVDEMQACEQNVIQTKRSIIQEKRAMKSQAVGIKWLEEISFPIFDTEGAIKYIGVLSRDISERKRAEENIALQQEQLKKAYQELQQSQEIVIRQEKLASLGTMIAGIAHEINNPAQAIEFSLTALQMNIDDLSDIIEELKIIFTLREDEKLDRLKKLEKLLYEKQIEEVFGEILSVVKDNKNAVNRISNIIRSIKRLVHNNIELSDCSINEIINDSVNLVKNQIKNNITIECHLQDNLPTFRGSAQEMGQVFINMLLNANDAVVEKSMRKNDAFVKLSSVYNNDEDMLEIRVKDNGSGIKSDVIDKIFDPFLTTKPVGKGTGLGLYISYQIIENHGGKIKVESSLETGTEFIITLPIKSKTTENNT